MIADSKGTFRRASIVASHPRRPSHSSRERPWPAVASRILLAVGLVAGAPGVHGQDLEPRAFANTPVGLNFLIASYSYATGGVVTDPSLPVENGQIDSHVALVGYARALDVAGASGKVDVIVPYATADGSAELLGQRHEREVTGFGDPRVRFSVNFLGAPAPSLQEFPAYRQDLILGASIQLVLPLGQYQSDKLLNLGTNRWTIKPMIGASKRWGPLTVEATAAAAFYTDNDDFFGGHTRAQDPLYSFEGHAIYSLPSGIWLAVDGTWYTGGRTTVDGSRREDLQSNTRLGLTAAFPVDRRNSVKLFGSTGVSSRTGTDFDTVGVAWQYRWGSGL